MRPSPPEPVQAGDRRCRTRGRRRAWTAIIQTVSLPISGCDAGRNGGTARRSHVEHRQPALLGADPHPILRIDVHRPHEVVAQPVLRAPDAEADAVVARQPVARGDPQITLRVLGDRVDAVRRQPIVDAELPRLRHAGIRGTGAGRMAHSMPGTGSGPTTLHAACPSSSAVPDPVGHARNASLRAQACAGARAFTHASA